MKRHVLCRKKIRGGNFGTLNCTNQTDVYTLDDIVDINAADLFRDANGYCYHRQSLIQDINTQIQNGKQPVFPHNRQVIPSTSLASLGIPDPRGQLNEVLNHPLAH